MSALKKQEAPEDAAAELLNELETDMPPAHADSDAEDDDTPAAAVQSIYDIPVNVSAVLGKTKMDVGALMKLQDGSIIELDRKVGEPIDLYVNDRLIARGELVMVDGALGVSMTEIVKDPSQ